MKNDKILYLIFSLILYMPSLDAQNVDQTIATFINNFTQDLNALKFHFLFSQKDIFVRQYFRGSNIDIADDITKYPPSNADEAIHSSLNHYLIKLGNFNCEIFLRPIKISKPCKNKFDQTFVIVTLNRSLTCNSITSQAVTRKIEIVIDNINEPYITAMAFYDNSVLISNCEEPVKLEEDTPPQPPSLVASQPVNQPDLSAEELSRSQRALAHQMQLRRNAETERNNLQIQFLDLQKQLAGLKRNSAKCMDNNRKAQITISALNDEIYTYEKEKQAIAEKARKEAERKKIAISELAKARAKYDSIVKKEYQLKMSFASHDEWERFSESESVLMLEIWKIMNRYRNYLDNDDNLIIVDMLGRNRGNIIDYLNPDFRIAANKANQEILSALGNAIEDSTKFQNLDKINTIIERIENYVKIQKQPSQIKNELEKAITQFDKQKEYGRALNTFIENQKYIHKMPNKLKYEVMYRQGVILLWNLGDITGAKGLSKKHIGIKLINRVKEGMDLLKIVKDNTNDNKLKRKAKIALAKYYAS